MLGAILTAALATTGPVDPQVTPAGFWPGGGTVWDGRTTYYGFGREAPYGWGGFGTAEPFGLRQDFGRNTDQFGPAGYYRPGQEPRRFRGGGWVGGGVGFGRWRR